MTGFSAYDTSFYLRQQQRSWRAAEVVADIVAPLVAPQSVIDIGCGTGGWLRAFQERGAGRVHGVDGPHVDQAALVISPSDFTAHDLTQSLSLAARFDLAISIEVAEHLPPDRAEGFIEDISRHSDVVLFSGAIPFQGGVNHVNEQWPSYWASKFAVHGYLAFDAVRPHLWNQRDIAYWYKQGVLLYARGPSLDRFESLGLKTATPTMLDVVHPDRYLEAADPSKMSIGRAARGLARGLRRRMALAKDRNR